MAQKAENDRSRPVIAWILLHLVNALVYLRHPRQIAKFRKRVGYYPSVAVPERYHEKMLWRKIFDRNPAFSMFCDKLASKQFYRTGHPDVPIIEPAWTGDSIDGEARALLDEGFILKANHGSGFIVFPEDYARDPEAAAQRSARWMEREYGRRKFEPAYRKARRCLLIEPRLGAGGETPVFDIYVRACMGKIAIVSILSNVKRAGPRFGYFDERGKRLLTVEPKRPDLTLADDFRIPARFMEAMEIARQVSKGYDYLRIDFLACGGDLVANEITIYPNAGLTKAQPGSETDINEMTSAMWDLRNSHFLQNRQRFPLELYGRLLQARIQRGENHQKQSAPGLFPGAE
jgi:hypothetical protein